MDVKAQARALSAGRKIKAEVSAPVAAPPVETETEVEVETPDMPTEDAPKFKAGDKVMCAGKNYTVAGDSFMSRCYDIKSADGSTAQAMEVNLEPGEANTMPTDNTTPAPQPDMSALMALQAQNDALMAEIKAMKQADENAKRDAALDKAGIKADLKPFVQDQIARAEGQSWDDAVSAFKVKAPSAFAEVKAEAKQDVKPVTPQAKLPAGVVVPEVNANAPTRPVSPQELRRAAVAARNDRINGGV